MEDKITDKNISIIGMTLDVGAGSLGARLGPEALRIAGLVRRLEGLGYQVQDQGDLDVANGYTLKEATDKLNRKDQVLEANLTLFDLVDKVHSQGDFPLILGGDHSLVYASGSAALSHYDNLGIIYFDAHTDINTVETSPSGNIHGMPIAFLMGQRPQVFPDLAGPGRDLQKENIVFIGLSDVDPGERDILKRNNIKAYTINDIAAKGIYQVTHEAIDYLKARADHVHVSFDIDVMDPCQAPGTGINLPGGLTFREARLALEIVSQMKNLVSMDFVEVNPLRDIYNQTAELSVDLLAAFFGEKLL